MEGFTFDSRGLIYNNDPGDCTAETGRYYAGLWFRKKMGLDISDYPYSTALDLRNALHQLTLSPGVLIRHPTIPYNDPFSGKFIPGRDQQHPLEVAVSLWASTENGELKQYFEKWLRNLYEKQSSRTLMKYQNNDYPNPSHKVVMRRYFGDISKIRLFWADGWLFGQSAITCHVVGKNTDDVADDLNHTLLLSHANHFMPTKMSKWAMSYYAKNRPKTFGSMIALEHNWTFHENRVLGAWGWYYRRTDPFTGEPKSTLWGMPELWRPWIEYNFA